MTVAPTSVPGWLDLPRVCLAEAQTPYKVSSPGCWGPSGFPLTSDWSFSVSSSPPPPNPWAAAIFSLSG